MKILLVDNGSRYINKLKKLTSASHLVKWNKITQQGCNKYDLVVLSGGHLLPVINHDQDYKAEIKLIKSINKPLIGICLGSELIAHVYGSKLTRLKRKEHRNLNIKEKELKFKVYENHRWAIKKLSNKLKMIARSKDGIEIFQHKTKPIFGLQFHPEVLVRKTDGKRIFDEIVKTIKL
jgi:anthranilate/para-aminobenzoate synthase component II